MGFRFRRSVKLLPGLRLNLSKGGVSLSAGIPGAHINFSPRGARTTFGVPGSGFSWSTNLKPGQTPPRYFSPENTDSIRPIRTTGELEETLRTPGHKVVYTRSRRKLSAQQTNALYRRLALQEWQQQAQAKIDKFESDLVERLNSWREMPSIPSAADYQAAFKIQPFVYQGPVPSAPNYPDSRLALEESIRYTIERETKPASRAIPLIIASLGLVAGIMLMLLTSQSGISASLVVIALVFVVGGLTGSFVVYSTKNHARRMHVSTEVAKRIKQQWPAREEELRSHHEAEMAKYDTDKAAAEHAWQEQEHERVAWASKLINGDEAAIHEAVCHTLADLDFPFETHAAFAVEDAKNGYLHLDLPEIENVVATTRHEVLKAGRVKEVKRNDADREYSNVACGVGLMMASAAFSAAPTLERVSVAAYTQRQQKGTGQIDDDYVYSVAIPRTAFNEFDVNTVNPVLFIAKQTGQMELQANHRFKKLPEQRLPNWVQEFRRLGSEVPS
jgi:hypothetical protein